MLPRPHAYVIDASVVVRWLVGGPYADDCQMLLARCGDLDARLLAPTCLYSEVANALYRLCLAKPPIPTLLPDEAIALVHAVAAYDIALVDRVRRVDSGAIALTPQWEQRADGHVVDYRGEIYARGIELSYPTRRGSLFDMSYAALAEQARTNLWTVDERFYNSARAGGLGFVMHPGRDPLP